MFNNPLKKYAIGGNVSAEEAVNQMSAELSRVLGIDENTTKARLTEILSNEEESQIFKTALAKVQQGDDQAMQTIAQLFSKAPKSKASPFSHKLGGKIHDFICKHAKGGDIKAGCGCKDGGDKVEKHQEENSGNGKVGENVMLTNEQLRDRGFVMDSMLGNSSLHTRYNGEGVPRDSVWTTPTQQNSKYANEGNWKLYSTETGQTYDGNNAAKALRKKYAKRAISLLGSPEYGNITTTDGKRIGTYFDYTDPNTGTQFRRDVYDDGRVRAERVSNDYYDEFDYSGEGPMIVNGRVTGKRSTFNPQLGYYTGGQDVKYDPNYLRTIENVQREVMANQTGRYDAVTSRERGGKIKMELGGHKWVSKDGTITIKDPGTAQADTTGTYSYPSRNGEFHFAPNGERTLTEWYNGDVVGNRYASSEWFQNHPYLNFFERLIGMGRKPMPRDLEENARQRVANRTKSQENGGIVMAQGGAGKAVKAIIKAGKSSSKAGKAVSSAAKAKGLARTGMLGYTKPINTEPIVYGFSPMDPGALRIIDTKAPRFNRFGDLFDNHNNYTTRRPVQMEDTFAKAYQDVYGGDGLLLDPLYEEKGGVVKAQDGAYEIPSANRSSFIQSLTTGEVPPAYMIDLEKLKTGESLSGAVNSRGPRFARTTDGTNMRIYGNNEIYYKEIPNYGRVIYNDGNKSGTFYDNRGIRYNIGNAKEVGDYLKNTIDTADYLD